MRLIPVILFLLVLNSCIENKKTVEYDMSASGAVNSIKEIDGSVYILNSTNSSILKISDEKRELFRDIDIKGRDFLLDFDVDGGTVYYSNTYDEIFKASGSMIEDTLKIANPDKIAVIGEKIFVTSRKAEDGYFYLISADKVTGKVVSRTALNDSPVAGGVFSTVSVCGSEKGVRLVNPFRSRLELYGTDLELSEHFDLDDSYLYGNFRIDESIAEIICSKDGSIFICSIDLKSGGDSFSEKKLNSDRVDLTVSAVTVEGLFTYNYIEGKIRILR